jgi:diacylglycerol O-acyltransferase
MSHSEPVAASERLHLDLDDANIHMHVAGAFVFERGPLAQGAGVAIDRIRDFVESRLYRVPRCRQRLARAPIGGELVWVDDVSFNLQYHVRHTHLPHPGDERQLKRLCGQLASQRLDREKPLWELHVVEGLEGDRFALVVKAHQCITNGIWEIGLIEALLSARPEVEDAEPAPVWLPRPAPPAEDLLRGAVRRRLEAPWELGRILLDASRRPEQVWSELRAGLEGFREATPASETPFNRRIGPHRRFDWLVSDAQAARDVAERFDTGIEAVALATLAGAIGRFFEQRGIPQADQRDFRMRAALPENAGGLLDDERTGDTLAWRVATLAIAEPDPLVRLEQVAEALEGSAHVGYELFSSASEKLWPGLYGALARRQLASRTSNLTLAVLSGPATERFLLGARLTEAFPLLPLVPDQALRIGLYVHGPRLEWGFNSDWDLLPDLHDLVRFTDECLRELCEAAGARAA